MLENRLTPKFKIYLLEVWYREYEKLRQMSDQRMASRYIEAAIRGGGLFESSTEHLGPLQDALENIDFPLRFTAHYKALIEQIKSSRP